MLNQGLFEWNKKTFSRYLIVFSLLCPFNLHASIIESTLGAAVVNDATATYYNPAGLTLLENTQMIMIGTTANFRTHFTGNAIQSLTGYTQSGSANSHTHYYLPSFYLGMPSISKVTIGLAGIYNYFYRDIEEDALLRYVQSSNRIKDINLIPAIGIKINEIFALGAGLDITYINFLLQPISGFPSLGIADIKSHNENSGSGLGGHIGILLKPTRYTTMGFNYRTAITYGLNGKSIFEGNPQVISDHYHFKFWIPARSVFSINHFLTPKLGVIGTIQYIQWSIFKDINIYGIATRINNQPIVLPNVKVSYHLRNTWLLTLGGHYRVKPEWVIRIAGNYTQSPANAGYQISNGDSIILAVTTGYNINKNFILDLGYAYAFIKNRNIRIVTSRNVINGVNAGYRNAFSLKLTCNV